MQKRTSELVLTYIGLLRRKNCPLPRFFCLALTRPTAPGWWVSFPNLERVRDIRSWEECQGIRQFGERIVPDALCQLTC